MSGREHIAGENLRRWRERARESSELCQLQIAALAREAASTISDGGEAPLTLPEALPFGDGAKPALTVDERLAFCREMLRLRPDLLQKPSVERTLPDAPRLARLSGELFSHAASIFAPLLPRSVPVYLSSLSELLEAVAAGEADFAILPVEDAKGNRFLHFYEEMDRLELHTTHICGVLSAEEGRRMRFALISKLYRPYGEDFTGELVEYRVPAEHPRILAELLEVAAGSGSILRRVDALPAPYSEEDFIHYPIFSAPEGTAQMDMYLRFFMPCVTLVGHYFHKKEVE